MTRASRDPLVGTIINGKFHVERAIARGGMGRVYYGTQAPLARPVALKIVKADSIDEDESKFLKRFLLEASILARLQHPNVVTLFDYGRIEGMDVETYFIAMEYLDGETLSERLRVQGALAAAEVLVLFRQVARGLREAHSRGILHRDLKPSNIVIVPEPDGEIVKLVDFGIGKDEHHLGEDLTRDGVLVGTPKYMAPEQFDGVSSAAGDVYALGTIVYQLLTGVLPFGGSTTSELMLAKLQDVPPPIREVNPICDASESLEGLVHRMLERRPEDRPTLDEVFHRLSICEEETFGALGRAASLASGARPVLGFPVSSKQSLENSTPPEIVTLNAAPNTNNSSTELTARSTSSPADEIVSGVAPTAKALALAQAREAAERKNVAEPRTLASPREGWSAGALRTAVVVAALGAVVWALRTRSTVDVAPPSPSPPPPSIITSTATTSPSPTAFVLHLDSTPQGAVVVENGTVLGITPIAIQVERATVLDRARTFELRKDGYTTTAFAQGVAESDLRQTVDLVKSESVKPVSSARPDPGPESDIRLRR